MSEIDVSREHQAIWDNRNNSMVEYASKNEITLKQYPFLKPW
jgi:hypothetical protein